jgi:hypothetical protein
MTRSFALKIKALLAATVTGHQQYYDYAVTCKPFET